MTPQTTQYLPVTPEHQSAIGELVNVITDWAQKKGWHEDQSQMDRRHLKMYKTEKLALIHSEVSECLEFLRVKTVCSKCGRDERWWMEEKPAGPGMVACECGEVFMDPRQDDKVAELPGESAELADAFIRILHYAGEFQVDLAAAVAKKHAFNITRPFRHGKTA